MFRAILYLIGFLLVTSVLRSVMGIIAKSFSGLAGPQGQPTRPGSGPNPSTNTSVGELKKDPVCGTFISTATAFQKAVGGQTYYFCSTQCRDQFKS